MTFPDESTIREIVELACRAPSVHNTQPWCWVVRGKTLQLYADTRRQLMHADSKRRDLVISCGAALHQLEVAARATGWGCRIRRTPEHSDPTYLAEIRFDSTSPHPRTSAEASRSRSGTPTDDRRPPGRAGLAARTARRRG